MFEVDPSSGETKPVTSLAAYLYDIGPQPHFVFTATVLQQSGSSPQAGRATLKVEQYILLQANEHAVYDGLENQFPDARPSPGWSYHSPVRLTFSRSSAGNNVVLFTSDPVQLSFLDAENPLTFARPADFTILGYAFRFALMPDSVKDQDINRRDNAFQLTFLKP